MKENKKLIDDAVMIEQALEAAAQHRGMDTTRLMHALAFLVAARIQYEVEVGERTATELTELFGKMVEQAIPILRNASSFRIEDLN